MSRSIGDVYLKKPEFNRDPMYQQFLNPVPMKRPVVTAEPSILTRNIKPQDMFLIFASDGLWEQLSDEAAVEIVFKNPRAVSSHTSTRIAFVFLYFFRENPNLLQQVICNRCLIYHCSNICRVLPRDW